MAVPSAKIHHVMGFMISLFYGIKITTLPWTDLLKEIFLTRMLKGLIGYRAASVQERAFYVETLRTIEISLYSKEPPYTPYAFLSFLKETVAKLRNLLPRTERRLYEEIPDRHKTVQFICSNPSEADLRRAAEGCPPITYVYHIETSQMPIWIVAQPQVVQQAILTTLVSQKLMITICNGSSDPVAAYQLSKDPSIRIVAPWFDLNNEQAQLQAIQQNATDVGSSNPSGAANDETKDSVNSAAAATKKRTHDEDPPTETKKLRI